MARKKKWIQGAIKKPGALRRQLGVKADETIPAGAMTKIMDAEPGDKVTVRGMKMAVTPTLKRRVALAKTLGKLNRKR